MYDQAEKLRQIVKNNFIERKSPVIKKETAKARIIAVTSGKGGVGKTNFTVNLALALSNLGQRVLIIDADLGMANADVVMGCSANYNILHLLDDKISFEDIINEGPGGIKFISGGSGLFQLANLGDIEMSRIINKLALLDSFADIILIDTGAGLNKSVLNFVIAADEVIIITTPEPTAITDAYAMIKTYVSHSGHAPLKVVVNRVIERDEGQIVIDKLKKVSQQFLNIPINSLGFIAEDRNLVKAVKKQTPLLLTYPDSNAAVSICDIANKLLNRDSNKKSNGIKGFFNKILELMK